MPPANIHIHKYQNCTYDTYRLQVGLYTVLYVYIWLKWPLPDLNDNLKYLSCHYYMSYYLICAHTIMAVHSIYVWASFIPQYQLKVAVLFEM